MARISQITLKEQPEYRWLAIRKTINFMAEYADFTSSSFGKIMKYLKVHRALAADGPLVCFHNTELAQLDIEVGFPIAEYLPGSDEICLGINPAQKIVTAIDLGAYEEQDPTLAEIFSWLQARNYTPAGDIYYQYLNDTDRPASQYLTKMMVPVL